jgi:hypothetical protein
MGEREGRMGSVMYRDYNSAQQQPAPHFNPSANPQIGSVSNIPSRSPPKEDAIKRSKTQFAHSEPDFNVMGISKGRRSIDAKVVDSTNPQ